MHRASTNALIQNQSALFEGEAVGWDVHPPAAKASMESPSWDMVYGGCRRAAWSRARVCRGVG